MITDTSIIINAIPAFIVLVIIEAVFLARENHKSGSTKAFLASLALGIGYVVLSPFTKGINLCTYTFLYEHRICDISENILLCWIICFVGDDLTYYWCHRLSHQVRYLWASHSVHHSAETFSLSAAFHQSWTNNLTGTIILWAWLPLIGINPAMLIYVKSINVIYQFWLHTEAIKKLPPWIEYIFNTPSHHRVHHGSNIEYLDKNHGGILIIWDRIFNTYQDEITTPQYGLTKNINSNNPFTITFYEWKKLWSDLKRATGFKDWLNYIFNAPGWSKDESAYTTQQLRNQAKKNNKARCNHDCTNCRLKLLHQKQFVPPTPLTL